MDYSYTVFVIFSILTLLMLVIKVLLSAKNSKLTQSIYYDIFYFAVVFIINLSFFIAEGIKNCGNVDFSTVLSYLILPWLVIFGGFIGLLNVYPYISYPFSNTFGYLVASLSGVNSFLIDFLKSPSDSSVATPTKKNIEKIYEDKSLFLNVFNTSQFEEQFKKFSTLFKNDINGTMKNRLFYYVSMKDSIANYIWYYLMGIVIISYSFMNLSGVRCNYSKAAIENAHNVQKELIKTHLDEKNKPKKVYKKTD